MAYTKTVWAARAGSFLNRYTKSNENVSSVELVNNPVIESAGTVFSPTLMNNIEDQVYALSEGNVTVAGVKTFTGIPAFNGGTTGESAPMTVDSTFLVTNLNADKVDGVEGSAMWYSSSGTGGSDGNAGQPPAPKPNVISNTTIGYETVVDCTVNESISLPSGGTFFVSSLTYGTNFDCDSPSAAYQATIIANGEATITQRIGNGRICYRKIT